MQILLAWKNLQLYFRSWSTVQFCPAVPKLRTSQQSVRACQMFAHQAEGLELQAVKDLTPENTLRPPRQTFIDHRCSADSGNLTGCSPTLVAPGRDLSGQFMP
jgi:hypothetical protein